MIGAPSEHRFDRYLGAAFVFERDATTGEWSPVQGLQGQEIDAGNYCGWDVAIGSGASYGTAVIGALGTQCPGGSQWDTIGTACVFDLDPADGSGQCPPPVLTLHAVPDCEAGRGGEIEVRWVQAGPDSRLALLYARQPGRFAVSPRPALRRTAAGPGVGGAATGPHRPSRPLRRRPPHHHRPRAACGGYLQLIDLDRCAASNVVRIQ